MKKIRLAVPAALAFAFVACGDSDTNDPRGYTKAPTENPGWTVEAEEPSPMADLGDPIRVPSLDTVAPDTAPAATAPATNPQPPAAAQQ